MTKNDQLLPPPPADLEEPGRRLWVDVVAEFQLRPDECAMLRELCHEVDLLHRLQQEMEGAPLLLPGSRGQARVNPLMGELRSHRQVAATLCRLLALGAVVTEGEEPVQLTPRQVRAKRAAEIRWSRPTGRNRRGDSSA